MLSPKTKKEIEKIKPKRIFAQIPEGLKTKALEIVKEVEEVTSAEIILSCEPCFGACDLRENEAELLGCDLLLHIGHSDFGLKTKIPVIYEEYEIKINFIPILRKNIEKLKKFKKISLLTTVQFKNSLKQAKNFLEREGKEIVSTGTVLGCNAEAAKKADENADCHLFIGSGLFHPLGVLEKTNKPLFFLDIESGTLKDLSQERNKMEIKKEMKIQKAKECKNFGIIVSTKPGQMNLKLAERLKEKIERNGRKAFILAMDEVAKEKLLGMKIDCLINTACPRIAEDSKKLGKFVIKPEDVDGL